MNSCWHSLRNCVDRLSSRNREYTRLMSSTPTSVPYKYDKHLTLIRARHIHVTPLSPLVAIFFCRNILSSQSAHWSKNLCAAAVDKKLFPRNQLERRIKKFRMKFLYRNSYLIIHFSFSAWEKLTSIVIQLKYQHYLSFLGIKNLPLGPLVSKCITDHSLQTLIKITDLAAPANMAGGCDLTCPHLPLHTCIITSTQ
jgi:hypothetical protein